jgi:hypothetical protein
MTAARPATSWVLAFAILAIGVTETGCGKYGRPRRSPVPVKPSFFTSPAPLSAAPAAVRREARAR